jgi:hypothetical protein
MMNLKKIHNDSLVEGALATAYGAGERVFREIPGLKMIA